MATCMVRAAITTDRAAAAASPGLRHSTPLAIPSLALSACAGVLAAHRKPAFSDIAASRTALKLKRRAALQASRALA